MPSKEESPLNFNALAAFNPNGQVPTAAVVWRAGTVTILDITYADGSTAKAKFRQGQVESGGDNNWGTGVRLF